MSIYMIAGATGRVGSAAARCLLERGDAIAIVSRDARRAAPWRERGARVIVGALGDVSLLTRALDGCDGFFTLLPEPFDAADFHADRRHMADAIALAVQRSGVPRVVMISSIGAEHADGTGPIRDLHHLEQALGATDARFTAVRSSMFQDNVASALEPARQAGIYPNLLPSRDVMIPMVATRDVGAIAARELSSSPARNDILDLLGPPYSPRLVAQLVGDAVGRTLEIVDIPAPGHVTALIQAGLPRQFAEAVAELQAAIAAGKIVPVGDRAETTTTTLEQTIASLIAPTSALQYV